MSEVKRIPVTVITGFLGAGKTTLLHHVLTHKHGKKIAVIENEFAQSIGVSNELHGADDKAACVAEIFETSNGCICCGSKDEFVSTLYELIRVKDRIDYLVIETTGRSDPAFVQIFEVDPIVKQHLYVDGIITLVDAQNVLAHMAKKRETWENNVQILNEAVEQIVVADRVVVNKTDLVSETELKNIEVEVRRLNPFAQIINTQYSKVDVSQVLDVKAYDIKNVLKQDEGFLNARPYRRHNEDVEAFNFEGLGSIDLEEFRTWMNKYLTTHEVMRAKGVLCVTGKDEKYIYQSVRHMLDITPFTAWGAEAPISKLVFIGVKMSEEEIMRTFPSSMKLQTVKRRGTPRPPGLPKSQFVMLGLAALFYKGADMIAYMRNNPVITLIGVLFLLAIYFYTKQARAAADKPKSN